MRKNRKNVNRDTIFRTLPGRGRIARNQHELLLGRGRIINRSIMCFSALISLFGLYVIVNFFAGPPLYALGVSGTLILQVA